MRGDLTLFKNDNTLNLTAAARFVLVGNAISGTNGAGVAKRDAEKSFRVSLGAASVEAAGGEGLIRLVLTVNKNAEGARVYLIVPANGKPAHGKITVRA
jgi:hypothetical protein